MASYSRAGSQRGPAVSTVPPPRSVNVHKFAESRAAELAALHTIVTQRAGGSFRVHRSKRRRTTSHQDTFAKGRGGRKRRKLGHGEERADRQEGDGEEGKKKKKKLPRRVRRRMELRKNMEFGFGVSGDGTERLRTHLWHAKRFTMVKRWGFYLPLGVHGKGRGSRAVLKRLTSGVLLHDSSYFFPIQLEGPEVSLLSILRLVLVQSTSDVSAQVSQAVIHGMCHGSAMLHHIGAPLSQFIAPVVYMWRPIPRDNIRTNNAPCSGEIKSSSRQLWIWVHAAAFSEGFGVLSNACQNQMNVDGFTVSCISLKGKLAKLEVIGSKANRIIQRILTPAFKSCNAGENSSCGGDMHLTACSTQKKNPIFYEQGGSQASNEKLDGLSLSEKFLLLEQANLPSCAILAFEVVDPRNQPSKSGLESVQQSLVHPPRDLPKEISEGSNTSTLESSAKFTREHLLSLWGNMEENCTLISDSKDLWVFHDKLQPPIKESTLSLEKYHKRLKHFCLDSVESTTLTSKSEESSSSSTCSVLLLKHKYQMDSHQGWSIILPLSWVKAFWIPLVSHGAYPIGLRERHWVASDGGIPYFPFDFPDCKAYSSLMLTVGAETNQIADLRPPHARPSRTPIPPPWDSVRFTVEQGLVESVEKQQQYIDELATSTSAFNSNMERCSSDSRKHTSLSFQGSISRTSDSLNCLLKSIHLDHLLLFPKTKMGKRAFLELMDKKKIKWAPRSMNKVSPDRPLCFTRVLLHACGRGAFEEGAIVCAPLSADLLLSGSRSEEPAGLQLPNSLADSYFTQDDSGKWALQLPEDPSSRHLHRWPIGFVTSGFVRGSAKPMALAACEATLLARLREEQWSEMQEKGRPEVLVLVRNMRSTAYRLSRATIVLEQGDDIDFM